MNKSIVNINFDKLNENDIIVFKKGKWVAVPGTVFLNGVVRLINDTNNRINNEVIKLNNDIRELNNKITELEAQIKVILGEDEPEETENEEE